MKQNNHNPLKFILFGVLLLAALSPELFAGATNMPWEDTLQKIRDSLSGPVAGTISLLGVIGSGAMLIMGEGASFSGAFRTLILLVLGVSIVITANVFIAYFSGTGAVIVL